MKPGNDPTIAAIGGNGKDRVNGHAHGPADSVDSSIVESCTPSNLEAEQIVLASLLVDPKILFELLPLLSPEHFTDGDHRKIFAAIKAVSSCGDPVDGVTVGDFLKATGTGISIVSLCEFAAYAPACLGPAHVRILERYAERRKIREIAGRIRYDPASFTAEGLQQTFASLRNENGKSQAQVSLISSSELLPKEGDEPIDYLIEDIIPRGSIILINGAPGDYKTTFALALAHAVADGQAFLGRGVEAAPVIYIDKENPRTVLGLRLTAVGASSNLKIWPYWSEYGAPMLGHRCYQDLAAGASLLIFDSLRRFHTAGENKPEEMAIVFGHLRELTKSGATVVVLHHSGKAEGNFSRGSTEIPAAVDVSYSLERDRETHSATGPVRLTLRTLKNRYIEELIFNLEAKWSGGRLTITDVTAERLAELEVIKTEQFEAVRQMMHGLAAQNDGEPNQSEMLGALKIHPINMGKKTALKLLSKGEGRYWNSEMKDGARRYKTTPFSPTLSPLSPYYRVGKGGNNKINNLDDTLSPGQSDASGKWEKVP